MHIKRQARQVKKTRAFPVLGWVVLGVIAWVGGLAKAQEVAILHSFSGISVTTDGSAPNSSLVQGTDGNFYGTTSQGGSAGKGSVFKMTPDGTTITILHSFGVAVDAQGSAIVDGTQPSGNLIFDRAGNLYGTTAAGGALAYGTVYEITAQGVYSILANFGNSNQVVSPPNLSGGAYPEAGVILGQDGNFYGTTSQGGDYGLGVVFRLKPDGTLSVIHSFSTTGDAASPLTGLVQDSQGNLYGTTAKGGSAGSGAIYKIDSSSHYSLLYSFAASSNTFTYTLNSASGYTTSLGGYSPNSPLAIGADGNLYGTTVSSNYGAGALYKVTPQGQVTFLHYFADGSIAGDGAETLGLSSVNISPPQNPTVADRLVVGSDGNFYGATFAGGAANKGAIFEITPTGQVTIIHSFGDGSVSADGSQPVGLIQASDGTFYGTTSTGGAGGFGAAFKITPNLPMFTSALQVSAAVGNLFTYQMVATQGPVTYSVGPLPTGFSFDRPTGIISGTPTGTGTLEIALTATNAHGSNTVPLVITVLTTPVITSLLDAVYSTSGLSYTIRATQNPTSFTATGLPPGVSVDPTSGTFYGVPTQAGTYQVTLSAKNPVGTGTAVLTLTLLSSSPTLSQEYLPIHSLGDGSVSGEGQNPGPMTLGTDGTFYGVTSEGGANGAGTVFNLSPAGNARVVASLGGVNGSAPQGVIQTVDGTLYGTTQRGGSANAGTIFKVAPDGTVSLLHTFGDLSVNNDGANPQCGLILASDGNFYGTTQYGGSFGQGTVYQMTPSGNVTILHSFGDKNITNDGAQPVASVVQDPNLILAAGAVSLVGTTLLGGAQGDGTLFAISSTGKVQIFHSFGDPTISDDGQLPRGALVISQMSYYGTTTIGGSLGRGTVFAYHFASQGVTILHSFGDGSVSSDGENPASSLVLSTTTSSGGVSTVTLYGTTQNGGAASGTTGYGTVFSCALDVTGSNATTTILHSFGDSTVAGDGETPLGGLCLGPDNNLYGTTIAGGDGYGTAYGIQIIQGSTLSVAPSTPWILTGTLPAGMTFDSATGTLSGTPSLTATAGIYALTISQGGSIGVQAPQTITINLQQTLSAWAQLHGVSALPYVASQVDGISNIMKFLCDIDPSTPMSLSDRGALPQIGMDDTSVPGTDYLTLTYRQSASALGVTATLESSNDMKTWTPVAPADLLSKTVSTLTNGDTMVELGTKYDGSVKQFIRLDVTTP